MFQNDNQLNSDHKYQKGVKEERNCKLAPPNTMSFLLSSTVEDLLVVAE